MRFWVRWLGAVDAARWVSYVNPVVKAKACLDDGVHV